MDSNVSGVRIPLSPPLSINLKKKAIIVCDEWPKDSYNFETSLGVKDGCLLGMMVDEDSQSELTEERITTYVAMLKKKFNL